MNKDKSFNYIYAGGIHMKLTIQNVAKVLQADIDLNGITVIAGLNNTGKSSILKAFYVIMNTFRNPTIKVNNERMRSLNTIIHKCEQYFDDNGYSQMPSALLYDLSTKLGENIHMLVECSDKYNLFKTIFLSCLENYAQVIEDIGNDFIFTDDFIKPIYSQIEEVLFRSKDNYLKYICEMYVKHTFDEQLNNMSDNLAAHLKMESGSIINKITIKDNRVLDMTYNTINEPNAVYIPSYHILDCLNSTRFNISIYSPIGDIDRLLSKNDLNKTYEDYLEINENVNTIKQIMNEIVHGQLVRLPSGKVSLKDNETANLINMGNVASGIKDFSLLLSLVENGELKKNSVLLIDEPETNLHLEWHLAFAEILVLMYKHMGVISVVNSHSPYFIRALEVKMADHGIKDNGSYYLMHEKEKNSYIAENVTDETNKIYELLYRPLEYL